MKAIAASRKVRAAKKQMTKARPVPTRAPGGYLRSFNLLPDDATFCKVSQLVRTFLEHSKKPGTSVAARLSVDLSPIQAALEPYLRQITEHACSLQDKDNKKLFPLKDFVTKSYAVIAALPKKTYSKYWYTVPVHRDWYGLDLSGFYTFFLFINDVTPDNGAIKVWKGSTKVKLDQRNPKKSLCHLGEPELLTGEKGCVWMFDGRLLHQSMPNMTDMMRLNVVWTVATKKIAPLIEDLHFK